MRRDGYLDIPLLEGSVKTDTADGADATGGIPGCTTIGPAGGGGAAPAGTN